MRPKAVLSPDADCGILVRCPAFFNGVPIRAEKLRPCATGSASVLTALLIPGNPALTKPLAHRELLLMILHDETGPRLKAALMAKNLKSFLTDSLIVLLC